MKQYNEYRDDPVEYLTEAVEFISSTLESLQTIQASLRTLECQMIDTTCYQNFVHDRHQDDIEAVTDPEGEYLADHWQEEIRQAEKLDKGFSIDDIPF